MEPLLPASQKGTVGNHVGILIVAVLYKKSLQESQTVASLSRAHTNGDLEDQHFRVLLWDNSPVVQENTHLSFPFEYRHAYRNFGVAEAYNRAADLAGSLSCAWLLLFDQDTTVPDGFLKRMLRHACQTISNPSIAVVAPIVFAGDRVFSPGVVRFYGTTQLPRGFSGRYRSEVTAINSGLLVRVASLREIGGYDERFWLDQSDIVMLRKLQQIGKAIYIAGDLQLQHLPSVTDYEGSMSTERYANFIGAEGAYWDLYRSGWENAFHDSRLLARSVKQFVTLKNKQIFRTTIRHLWNRVFVSREERLNRWNRSLQVRLAPPEPDITC